MTAKRRARTGGPDSPESARRAKVVSVRLEVDAELRREYDARGNAIGHAEQT
jgi:hypothetical protein